MLIEHSITILVACLLSVKSFQRRGRIWREIIFAKAWQSASRRTRGQPRALSQGIRIRPAPVSHLTRQELPMMALLHRASLDRASPP